MKEIKHVAIILDGNRRWAEAHKLPKLEGHRRGYENVKAVGEASLASGLEHLTVFGFSTENWKRSEEEVSYLMDLLLHAMKEDLDFFIERGIRVRVPGRREGLSQKVAEAIAEAEERTAEGTAGQINICINYGGRAEIVDGVKALIEQGVPAEEITEERVAASLWTADIPDPELIIRTSGEQRLSGFLAWSGVYSELMFVEKNWPDFSPEDLKEAIENYKNRDRRFGR